MFYKKNLFLVVSFFLQISWINAQEATYPLNIKLTVEDEIKGEVNSDGRLFVFLSTQSHREPRTITWPSVGNYIFARNIKNYDATREFVLSSSADWNSISEWSLKEVPEGTYYLQVLWDQDREESQLDAPGNIYSLIKKLEVNQAVDVEISLSEIVGPRTITDHKFAKEITFKSDILSAWWNKEMVLKASVLLPGGYYDHPNKKYPVRYNIAGYGGRYTRINNLIGSTRFTDWWFSDEAPQIINVFLDGEGPFGDSYQMDSENSGPYGSALINELIPHIEKSYR